MADRLLKGVYSTERTSSIGSGMTKRKAVQKQLWAVWDYNEDNVLAQPLNAELVPGGQKRVVPFQEFLDQFTPEPELILEQDSESTQRIWQADDPQAQADDDMVGMDWGDNADRVAEEEEADRSSLILDDDELPARAPETAPPVEEVEHTARMQFGLAIASLKRGDKLKARKLFEELAEIEGDFQVEHKHMFNEFGIGLRKNNMADVAVKHYNRAATLNPSDENIYHNLARAYYEMKDYDKALEALEKSLEINPGLRESELFYEFILRKHKKNDQYTFNI